MGAVPIALCLPEGHNALGGRRSTLHQKQEQQEIYGKQSNSIRRHVRRTRGFRSTDTRTTIIKSIDWQLINQRAPRQQTDRRGWNYRVATKMMHGDCLGQTKGSFPKEGAVCLEYA